MAITAVELYEWLREKLGTEEASLLVRYVEEAVERRAATKADLLETRHSLEGTIGEVRRELEATRQELEAQISKVERDLLETKHALEWRMDRTFSILLAAMIILNGDKVLAFLSALLALVR